MKKRLLLSAMAATMFVTSEVAVAEPSWRHAGTIGMREFVVVKPAVSTDAETLMQAANSVCAPERSCVVEFWAEGAAVPKKMPMTQAQKRSVIARFFRNPAAGSEELLLKCRADEPAGQKCLR